MFESLNKSKAKPKLNRKSLVEYLENGGMPGIFAVRDRSQWNELYLDWVSLTVERDIFQTKIQGLDKNVALGCLKCACTLPLPTLSQISKELRIASRVVAKHLEAPQTIFVLQKIDSHPRSQKRASIFLPFEVGLAQYLGASEERRLHVYLMNERLVYLNETQKKPFQFWYYTPHTGNMIHWVEESEKKLSFQISRIENLSQQDIELSRTFSKRNGYQSTILQPGPTSVKVEGVQIESWQSVANQW